MAVSPVSCRGIGRGRLHALQNAFQRRLQEIGERPVGKATGLGDLLCRAIRVGLLRALLDDGHLVELGEQIRLHVRQQFPRAAFATGLQTAVNLLAPGDRQIAFRHAHPEVPGFPALDQSRHSWHLLFLIVVVEGGPTDCYTIYYTFRLFTEVRRWQENHINKDSSARRPSHSNPFVSATYHFC